MRDLHYTSIIHLVGMIRAVGGTSVEGYCDSLTDEIESVREEAITPDDVERFAAEAAINCLLPRVEA